MENQYSDKWREVVRAIEAVSAASAPLPPEAVKYARSTLSDQADIFELAADDAASEAACLTELLFFPDQRFQTAVEARLGGGGLSSDQIRRLVETLEARPPVFRFAAESRDTPRDLAMPPWAVAGFVDRLRLNRVVPRAVRAALGRWEKTPDRLLAFVKLRNAGHPADDESSDFLVRLLDRLGQGMPDKWALLDNALELLGMRPKGMDMFSALCFIKGRYVRMIKQQRDTARLMAKGAMETLLLQKVPIAARDEAELRENISRLDQISQMVYGLAPLLAQEGRAEEQITAGDADGLLEMIRRMAL